MPDRPVEGARTGGARRRSRHRHVWQQPLWRRWVVANAVGECVGLGLTGLVAGTAVLLLGSRWAVLSAAAVIASGAVEGTVVGAAQWRVLGAPLGIGARRWILATVVGALLAWGAGVTPMLLVAGADMGGGGEPGIVLQLVLAAGLGLIAGPVLGGPQALALRGHVRRAGRWVIANALAWGCALPLTFLGPALLPEQTAVAGFVVVFALGALIAGAVAGAVHGVLLVALVDERAADAVPQPAVNRLTAG